MNKNHAHAVIGVTVAIAVTTAMDATGYTMFSALPLMPLAGLFWYLQRFSRQEIGLVWGNPGAYAVAVAFPVLVLGLAALAALMLGAVDTSSADWNKAILNMAVMSSIGILMVLITEEGFFRGWLWAALKRTGFSDGYVLI